jgi:hypothetical protein
MRLAIIGTAGRADDGKRLASDPEMYLERMQAAVLKVRELTGSNIFLSGGASWADHCAVLLYNEYVGQFGLELELPARLVDDGKDGMRYEDHGTRDFKNNPGAVSNHYLKLMQKAFVKTRPHWSPFKDFHEGSEGNVVYTVTPGFLARNLVVAAKADHVIAMTFGSGAKLKEGGTAHTMRAFLARPDHGDAYHLDLNTLKLYKGATT